MHAHLPGRRDDIAECGTGKGLYASDTGSKHYMHTYLNIGMTSPDAVQVKAYMQAVPVIQRYRHTYLDVVMTSPDAVQVMADMQAVSVSKHDIHTYLNIGMTSPDMQADGRYASGTGNPTVHAHLPERRDDVAGCGTGNGRCASATDKQTLHAHMHTYLNVGMTSPDTVQVMADMQAVPVSQQCRHYECHWPQNTTDDGAADVSSRGVAVVLTGVEIMQTCCPQVQGVEARIMTGRVFRDLNAAMSLYLVQPTESKVKIVSEVVRIR